MVRFVLCALAMLLSFHVTAAELKKPKLEWCLDELPPRHFFVDGVPKGPMVAMMKKLAERAGFELTFSQPTPASRCLHKMKNGQTDLMTGLLYSEERSQNLLSYGPLTKHVRPRLLFAKIPLPKTR